MIKNYWKLTTKEIFKNLQTSDSGLSSNEAQKRLKKFGENSLKTEKDQSAISMFLIQFKSPLVIVLIVASLISLFLKEQTDATIILIMVFLSTILSFVQEYRSKKALEKLRQKIALKSQVIRDNKIIDISSEQIVPGDLVIISSGKIIPADLRLIQTEDLQIDESTFTGESFPASKNILPLDIEKPIPQDLRNIAFMGTSAIQGSGKGIVIATAKSTEFGKTASLLTKETETEFEKGFNNFAKFLIKVILILATASFIVLAFFKHEYSESLLFALALAVGISPELLPVILTVNLASAAKKMARKQVIVKKLIAIEDLGNADIIATDKTGTLTEGVINLIDYFNLDENHEKKIIDYAYSCNTKTLHPKNNGNPLDLAIISFIEKRKILIKKTNQIVDEISFDYKRRRMSVIIKNDDNYLLICKGAVEEILEKSTKIEIKNDIVNIDKHKATVLKKYQELSNAGHKVLCISYKNTSQQKEYPKSEENNLIFLGFLVFSDTPKESARQSLQELEKLGAKIKILTGDNELVTKTICQKLNLKIEGILLGHEIEKLSDQELKEKINQTNIFAKITPGHKLRIIKTLKQLSHTVAYLGDGINDAPALFASDVGISFKEASDVAKESAQIILLEKSLAVLTEGIKEGRKTFGNTIKFIFVTISSNFGNMVSLALTSLFLPFIPLLPSQILLLNFISDLPLLAIATDRVDANYLNKPKHWNIKTISRFMIFFGLISSIFDIATFAFLLYVVKTDIATFRTAWFLESVLTEIAIIFAIRTKNKFFKSKPSHALIASAIISIAVTLFVVYSPINHFFFLNSLSLPIIMIVLGLVTCYFVVTEISKKYFYKKFED